MRYYDYGPVKNLRIYGQVEAPAYDISKLENFKIDTFITTSDGDPYCIKEDFEEMLATLKNAKVTVKHLDKYNHLDYLWSRSANIDIYEDILGFLNDI